MKYAGATGGQRVEYLMLIMKEAEYPLVIEILSGIRTVRTGRFAVTVCQPFYYLTADLKFSHLVHSCFDKQYVVFW